MLRWAVIGTSFISDTMTRAIAASPGSCAVAVVGRDPARREAFRARHGILRAYASVDDAVADPEVDVVYVGVPNHVHHDVVVVAARAGKAILSEKSLCVSMAQADALLSAVQGNVFFVEGLMYLAHPVITRFLDVLGDGRLGRLKAVDASYAADIWKLVNPHGRGAIYNLGCYPASLVQLVVDAVHGDGAFDAHDLAASGNISATDGNVCETVAALRFDCGVLATLHTAETYGNVTRFVVHGEHGTLAFVTNPWLPKPGPNTFVWSGFDGSHEVFTVDDPLDAFDHQVRMVERHVGDGRREATRPSPRLADSRRLMRALTQWEAAAVATTV